MPANNAFYYIHNLYTFIKFKEEIRMANETQKFLSYEGLGTYDSKVKAYIVDKADAAKTSAIKADAVVVTTDVTTEGYAKSIPSLRMVQLLLRLIFQRIWSYQVVKWLSTLKDRMKAHTLN